MSTLPSQMRSKISFFSVCLFVDVVDPLDAVMGYVGNNCNLNATLQRPSHDCLLPCGLFPVRLSSPLTAILAGSNEFPAGVFATAIV